MYNFPYDVEEDDEETIAENSELRAMLPFAIVGSEEEIMVNGEPIRGRRYPWGIVDVDNPQHSDFSRLKTALLSYVLYTSRLRCDRIKRAHQLAGVEEIGTADMQVAHDRSQGNHARLFVRKLAYRKAFSFRGQRRSVSFIVDDFRVMPMIVQNSS